MSITLNTDEYPVADARFLDKAQRVKQLWRKARIAMKLVRGSSKKLFTHVEHYVDVAENGWKMKTAFLNRKMGLKKNASKYRSKGLL